MSDPTDSPDDRDRGDRRDDNLDEIAVTDVPESVRDELTALFGVRGPGGGQSSEDDPTPPSVGAPTRFSSESGADDAIVIDGDSDSTPTNERRVVLSVDPLLGDGEDGTQVQIIEDNPELVVIGADEMDRVVIVDEDRPDPIFEERERRRRRRQRLKRVKWLKVAALLTGIAFVVLVVLASPLFAVKSVSFEGAVYTSTQTKQSVVGVLKGESVFTVDTKKARTLLLADPWVADVRITTRVSGTAIVEIAERTPVVWYVGADQKARVIDARGHVIAVLTGWPTKYLQVRGAGPLLEAGTVADPVYRAAAQLVLALPDELRPKVLALDLSPGGELTVVLKAGTLIRFGPPTDLQNKLVAVVVLLRRQNPSTLAVVDVSTGEPTVQTR